MDYTNNFSFCKSNANQWFKTAFYLMSIGKELEAVKAWENGAFYEDHAREIAKGRIWNFKNWK